MNQANKHKKESLISSLKSEMNSKGFWDGQLSSSALSTAVAIAALQSKDAEQYGHHITQALAWLNAQINHDGGFGDTASSKSNISTTLLVYAALNLLPERTITIRQKVSTFLAQQNIDTEEGNFQKTILDFYNKDYTFSVPILTMCALCGLPKVNAFDQIPQLPFELALLPRNFYRFLNLSVVSYAIPALIAVGIATHKQKPMGLYNRTLRSRAIAPCLKQLQTLCPESGGFLEAIPLTAFVALSLCHAGFTDHQVVQQGIDFLIRTQREDGAWPIDIDLSTWVTTLAVKSLGPEIKQTFTSKERDKIINHLLSTQNREVHPFNGTSPGGWGWTHYSGSVPDGDDTSGVILALIQLNAHQKHQTELEMGVKWLLQLQNSDGGFPTFSRGWGKLPFDQSCADITGHAILAMANYCAVVAQSPIKTTINKAIHKAIKYLHQKQLGNGSWHPLWFGNQQNHDHKNPIYGTARVSAYLADTRSLNILNTSANATISDMLNKGFTFLSHAQNSNGSWGHGNEDFGTIEESALAINALKKGRSQYKNQINDGLNWLETYTNAHGLQSAPIGLYFASLWYDEKMYPLVAYLEALSEE